ncbi:MAG: PEP/pyruvate-binding domain-containing protein [Anaerolineae bacterium]|nr:PEP/pyruvate-binding domain-containing protein [Anaerolineae bacterium]
MILPNPTANRAQRIYLALAQYPISRTRIRAKMRRELFARGIITPNDFDDDVRKKAEESQAREGLNDPLWEETQDVWETRLARVRSHLTDYYFSVNLSYDTFEDIVKDVLSERVPNSEDIQVSFNPELAPQKMLFEQARAIMDLPPKEYINFEHRYNELIVVLIRRMISDQLAYINIAKSWFTIEDLNEIRKRKIGHGKIGGKAAGMLLAARILHEVGDEDIRASLHTPPSYYLGSDVMYVFMHHNDLMFWANQKYKSDEQIHLDYPKIIQDYCSGHFPKDIILRLQKLLLEVNNQPLIVRSSSLLEDNFGTSFAGKYESIFCPNQGTPEENLKELTLAIAEVYASGLNPDALLYRRSMGLQDYDERLAILIQVVEGEEYGDYFFPHLAGVGFSRNLYRWSPQINGEDGFLRLVWGLGTRAVDRVGKDYPRLVALSHPSLRPESELKAIHRYSQHNIDLLNLKKNQFESLPIVKVLDRHYPPLRLIAQTNQGGYLAPIRSSLSTANPHQYVLTFESLLERTPFADRMKRILNILESQYNTPVDMEFAVKISDAHSADPKIEIAILQCRPQSPTGEGDARIPEDLHPDDIIFSTSRMVPQGIIDDVQYVLFVSPKGYYALPTQAARSEVGRAIGRINLLLKDKVFICMGPGRWGTRNSDLGVNIRYADIYNTRSLVELAGKGIGLTPDPSFGTHFFQDLMESRIFPLAIFLDDKNVIFKHDFFYKTPNQLRKFAPKENHLKACIRIIDVATYRKGHHIDIVMDNKNGQAVAYLHSGDHPAAKDIKNIQ